MAIMSISGETAPSEFGPEADPVQILRDKMDQFYIDQANNDNIEVLYSPTNPDHPIGRLMSGSTPSRAQAGVVPIDIVRWDTEVDQTTTVSLGKQQFQIDGSGVIRLDRHQEDPDEENVVAKRLQECITPGYSLWSRPLARRRAAAILAMYSMYDR